MLEDYSRHKELLLQRIAQLEELLDKYNDKEFAELVEEQKSKLKKSQFNLVVLGQFKRGKSTFINALLGEEILPTGVLPLTAIITRISFAEQKKTVVFFLDGNKKDIKTSELSQYVTETANPQNKKGVKEVHLFYPSELLKKGIILVDTPGIGSVHENNTRMTLNYIKYADVVVFILAVDPPLTKEEIDFLATVKETTDKIVFVLNKTDTMSDSEQQEILNFSKRLIKKKMGTDKAIVYPLSAKKAFEKSFSIDKQHLQFMQDLENMILGKKGKIIIHSVSDKVVRVAKKLLFHLELENKVLLEPLTSLEEKMNKAEEQLKAVEKKKKESIYLFQGAVNEIIKDLEEDLLNFKEKETKYLLTIVEKEIAIEKQVNIKEKIKDFLEKEIKKNFEKWRQEKKAFLDKQLKNKTEEFVSEINQIMEEIQTIFATLFDIDFYQLNPVEEIIESKDFYFHIKEETSTFYPKLELATFSPLLPSFMRNNIIRKKIREEIINQVDKNCGRLRYDFSYRISETAKQFIYYWESEIKELLHKIENVVIRAKKEKNKNMQKVETREKELQYDLMNLKNLIEEFKIN